MKRRVEGDWGEDLAAGHLESLGYAIIERKYRSRSYDEFERPLGEVDIVAERGEELVFVEVRSRATGVFGGPEDTVTAPKRRRVVRAAVEYLARNHVHDRDVRFDVISVVRGAGGPTVQHIEGAFDAGY